MPCGKPLKVVICLNLEFLRGGEVGLGADVVIRSAEMEDGELSFSNGGALSSFVRIGVTDLERSKGLHADRACETALGDFVGFVSNGSILLDGVSTRLVVKCRACLGRRKTDVGAISFCVHVLHTACGHTMSGKIVERHFPFGRICAKIRGAIGQTVSFGMVERLGRVSLDRSRSVRFTHSVFVFDFCAQKVSFISVTFLGGASLGGNVLACEEGGANRLLSVE